MNRSDPHPAGEPPQRDITWKLWPLLSWGVALFVTFYGFFFGGGWETLFLLMFSPLIVPAIGLLEMLPRFVLRKRGHTMMPAAMACIAPVHWALFILVAMSMRGSTDAAPTDSGLRVFAGTPLWVGAEDAIGGAAAVATIATGITLFVLSFVLKPSEPPAMLRPRTAPLVAASLSVALIVAAPQAAAWATSSWRDSAGTPYGHAMQLPLDEQVALLEARYTEAQEEFSEVRSLAGEYLWQNPSWRLESPSVDEIKQYSLELAFMLADNASLDVEAFARELEALGYHREGTIDRWSTPNGNTIAVEEYAGETNLRFTTPRWWGDGYDVSEAAEAHVDEVEASRYAATEYPGLHSVSAPWIVRDWSEILWTRYLPYDAKRLDPEGGLDAAGLTRAEGLAAYDIEIAQERAEGARQLFADLAARVGTETHATPAQGSDFYVFDRELRASSYANGSATADQYGHMVGDCFEQPATPVNWKTLAAALTDEAWSEVTYAEGALAAVHPNANIGVVYETQGALCVAVRTPLWWGELH